MKKKFLTLALITAVLVGFGSQFLLSAVLRGKQVTTSIQTLQLENFARHLIKGGKSYSVKGVRYFPEENAVELSFEVTAEMENETKPAPSRAMIPEYAYDIAKQTPETITVVKETESKTEAPPLWPLSASLGVAASIIFAAIWVSRQEIRGNATSMLLEEGLENMSVRDAEIVGEVMRREEFTIPELMKKARTSKITTWRTVKKLVEKGLVKDTKRTKPPSRGLGGRGKPSQVYKYIGPRTSEE